MPPQRKIKSGMTKSEALSRIEDVEDPEFCSHSRTYDLVVEGMNDNIDDHEIQRKGCWALALGSILYAKLLIQAGAVECTLRAMARFPMDERLNADGCECLRLLCSKREGVRRAMAANAVKAIAAAYEHHSQNPRFVQEACGALTKFAKTEAKAVLAIQGYPKIVHAMEMFPRYSWVQMWGCQSTAAFGKLNPITVKNMDGYTRIEDVMRTNKDVEAVQVFGQDAMDTKPQA